MSITVDAVMHSLRRILRRFLKMLVRNLQVVLSGAMLLLIDSGLLLLALGNLHVINNSILDTRLHSPGYAALRSLQRLHGVSVIGFTTSPRKQ